MASIQATLSNILINKLAKSSYLVKNKKETVLHNWKFYKIIIAD